MGRLPCVHSVPRPSGGVLPTALGPCSHSCRPQPLVLLLFGSQRCRHMRQPAKHTAHLGRRLALCTRACANTVTTPARPEAGLNHLEGKLRVVGLGARGCSAVRRLASHEKLSGAQLWLLDLDRAALEGAAGLPTIMLDPHSASGFAIPPNDLEQIVGEGAADKDGKGNINVGDGGVAFVLANAGTIPGGSHTAVGLVSALRAAGHFTAVAVTQPFDFEGPRKLEAAAQLIAQLKQAAHMVVVVEQDVLSRAGGGEAMTVAEATLIADNALEHTVRCILQALLASELLKTTRGALAWHGKDLRHYRRLLPPPLQRLLSCPGTGALGRGLARLPASSARAMGRHAALMHLASDAVHAAAESPFLESAIGCACAVLCCLLLPASQPGSSQGGGEEEHAARLAVQAAAGALISLTSGACDDIVLCALPRTWDGAQASTANDDLQVEVSMLVLRAPGGAAPPSSVGPFITRNTLLFDSSAPAAPPPPQQVGRAGGNQKIPASSWEAMSALARGGDRQQPYATAQATPPRMARPARDASRAAATFFAGPASHTRRPPAWQEAPAQHSSPHPGTPPPSVEPLADNGSQLEHLQQRQSAAETDGLQSTAGVEGGSVGDVLVDTLTAQSLDLPPQAARWRQQQRGGAFKHHKLIVFHATDSSSDSDDELEEESGLPGVLGELLGGRRREVDVRQRTSGILLSDRSESGDFD